MFGLDHLRLREGGRQLLNLEEAQAKVSSKPLQVFMSSRRIVEDLESRAESSFPTAKVREVNKLAGNSGIRKGGQRGGPFSSEFQAPGRRVSEGSAD